MTAAARRSEMPRIRLFLRIKHPDIDPAEISRALEVEPEHAHQAGATVSSSGVRKIHSETYWLAELPVSSVKELWGQLPLRPIGQPSHAHVPPSVAELRSAQASGLYDLQLSLSLVKLETRRAFLQRIVAEAGTVTLVLQRADRNAPMTIGPGLARRLADLEIRLEID